MGRALGGNSLSGPDKTPGGGDVRRRETGFASAATRAFSHLPIREALGASGRLRRGGSRLLQCAARLDRAAGARSVGRATGATPGSKDRSASTRTPAPETWMASHQGRRPFAADSADYLAAVGA